MARAPKPPFRPLSGFQHLPGHLDASVQAELVADIRAIAQAAPFYTPEMPRTGRPFSVRMTNCGPLGWVSDKAGYRYQPRHPKTDAPWPAMPVRLLALWHEVAGCDAAEPEACLVNWYGPDAKLGMHVDADEEDTAMPVVSVSLGDDAWFRLGGLGRKDPTARFRLASGDVVVLGGEARLAHHGVDRILPGTSLLLDAPGRINLTLRRVSPIPG